MITELYTHVSFGLLLGSTVQTAREYIGTRRLRWLPSIVASASFLPILGLSLGNWVFSFSGPISVPLSMILSWYVLKPCFSDRPISKPCLATFWSLTVGIAALYYPMALGWTSFDPHGLGWTKQFVFVPIVVALICLWLGQGGLTLVFVASALAWKFGLLQSANGWNYLIDPIAFGVCAISFGSYQLKSIIQRRTQAASSELTLPSAQVYQQRADSKAA